MVLVRAGGKCPAIAPVAARTGWFASKFRGTLPVLTRPKCAHVTPHVRWGCGKGLDHGALSVEDGITTEMRTTPASIVCLAALALFCLPMQAEKNQDAAPPPKTTMDQTSRVTIEVSGGEKSVPVENASVYIKYVEEHKVKKNKTVELNVKTNRDGTAHVPDAPMGRALVQVVADGWKTYGRWYDVTDPKQTIKIHLDKPPKWY